jgi:molybdopterin/thiamine biosynthesis adenylyltransferase
MDFTEQQINRYARHILLKEVGGLGQQKLLNSKVLVIGAGGLGSPLLLYLAAAGVGTIGIVDNDFVDLSNLQRQVIHTTGDIGNLKIESAAATVRAINPDVNVNMHNTRFDLSNATDLVRQYDLIADGSDNFSTRFLVNDACYFENKTLVSGAILRFDGQVATFKSHLFDTDGGHGPCYRCIFREPPPEGQVPSCAEAGVLGALCGLIGSMQASEILKELIGIGESLSGFLMICDGLGSTFRKIKVKNDPGCPLCGDQPIITKLSSHAY